MKSMTAFLGALVLASATLVPLAAGAQDFPSRPFGLLIPFPPGGGTDFVSRVVASALTEHLKWQVIPENRPGASGNLAVAQAALAPPDGDTIVMGQSDNMALGPYLYANVGYDTIRSFAPIIQVSEAPLALVTTAGNGSMGHMYGEQFKSVAAINLLQVPYKGAAPALADVMGGQVDVAIMSVPSVPALVIVRESGVKL